MICALIYLGFSLVAGAWFCGVCSLNRKFDEQFEKED